MCHTFADILLLFQICSANQRASKRNAIRTFPKITEDCPRSLLKISEEDPKVFQFNINKFRLIEHGKFTSLLSSHVKLDIVSFTV